MVVVLESVSRSKSLKIPKKLDINTDKLNSFEDELSVKKMVAIAENKKFNKEKEQVKLENQNKDLKIIDKIPNNASELMVITIIKKLFAYIAVVTEKSPKKYRAVFVNRMQNHTLDALENTINANFINMSDASRKALREKYQQNAIVKLKMLGYVAMLSESVGCILPKQYKQISMQSAYAINLIAAWKKSDDKRYKNKGF